MARKQRNNVLESQNRTTEARRPAQALPGPKLARGKQMHIPAQQEATALGC